MLENIAESIGSTAAALRLAITLFAAYGFAALHRWKFCRQPPTNQHLYFVSVGVALIWFNYGLCVYHSAIGVLVAYLLCNFIGGTVVSVIIAFVFYMGYLSVGYWVTATDSYDILWTLPQCILTMRLIGLVADIYDARNSKNAEEETLVKEPPTLLEIAAYTYFFGSCIVGPQFPMTRFRDFVNGRFDEPYVQGPLNRVSQSLYRLVLGLLYMAAHVFLFLIYPTDYFLSEQFQADNLGSKLLTLLIWFRIILLRYQAVWLITEGSCILSGLAYNGRNENNVVLWDAVRNIRMVKFEFGSSFQSVIESFNYNTNQWAAKYVFKRLRFLGNKNASHMVTLLFLAVWHGFYTGYLGCFGFEFACVMAERGVSHTFYKNNSFKMLTRTPEFLFPLWVIKKTMVTFGCAFGLIPFALLTLDRWIEVYKRLYFLGWIIMFIGAPLLSKILVATIFANPKKKTLKENHYG